MNEVPMKEGFVSFGGYNVWYRIIGEREAQGKFPLLCLHGGPGATHGGASGVNGAS